MLLNRNLVTVKFSLILHGTRKHRVLAQKDSTWAVPLTSFIRARRESNYICVQIGNTCFGIHAGTEDVAAMPVWFAPKFGILMHFDTRLFPVGQQ